MPEFFEAVPKADLAKARFALALATAPARFNRKLRKNEKGCWIWTAATFKNGYGRLLMGGRTSYAHLIAWQLVGRTIPAGHKLCHTCDSRACVNPDHLFTGTRSDNMQDMISKGRAGWQIDPEAFRARGHVLGTTYRGERHAKAKLKERDVIAIRVLIASGVKHREIAKEYGVATSTIGNIGTRHHWRSV